jgi:integrase
MPKLTKRFVDGMKTGQRDVILWDDELPRFGLRVKPTGAKTFVLQYRNAQGRTRRLALGRVGELTPDQARAKAQRLRQSVRDGADPSAARHDARVDPTVAELVEQYLADGPADKPAKKASSWATDASNLRRHVVPILGRRHLATLTTADIQRFQRDVTQGKTAADVKTKLRGRAIVEGGPGTAARATVVLGAMLSWAVARGLRPANPAKGVKLNKLAKRERYLTAGELARLGEAFAVAQREGVNPLSLAALRLLLLSGCRKNEVLSLQWEHVDFDAAALRLPDSKTGTKVVPLGAPALKVLADHPRQAGSPYVFPAARGNGHHVGLPSVWRKVASAAGLKGVRIHDLRHGFASIAVADGSSLYIVGKVLGHTQAATTERYSHLDLDPVRAVADRTSRKIAAALQPAGGEVISLKRRI